MIFLFFDFSSFFGIIVGYQKFLAQNDHQVVTFCGLKNDQKRAEREIRHFL